MKRSFRAAGVVGVLALLMLPPAGEAEAGVVYTGAARRLEAEAETGGPEDVDADFLPSTFATSSFAEEVSSEYRAPGGERMRARATQSSTIGDGFVRASGEVAARSELDPARYSSSLGVELRVTEPTPYALDASFVGTRTGPRGPADSNAAFFSVFIVQGYLLTRPGPLVTGTTVTQPEFESGAERPEFSATGTLAPGAYLLRLAVSSFADAAQAHDPADVQGSYTLDFRYGDGVELNPTPGPGPNPGPGPGPQPGPGPGPGPVVPLPPAVWGGLLTLGGIAAARLRASRRSA